MEDDGYHTQQRRSAYQQDGRIGSRGDSGNAPQRVRILFPTPPQPSSSPYMDYPQGGEDSAGPQVIRILPRAVYNLKHDNPAAAAAAGRRGSVDTGLAHVIRVGGRNEAPQVIRLGSGYPDGADTNPRVIRYGQESGGPQVIHIGPSGRILSSRATGQPPPQHYYTQRPQDFESTHIRGQDPSGTYSPPGMRVFSAGSPYNVQSSNQSTPSGSESPRIISIGTPQQYPHSSGSSHPSNVRYMMRQRPEGSEDQGTSEWYSQSQDQQPQHSQQRAYVQSVQSPTVIYSTHPGFRTIATTRGIDPGSTGSNNGVNESQEGRPGRMHLRDVGRSDSRGEMYIYGSNPVNIQMSGGPQGGPRRGSVGMIQVIPMRREQVQQPQQQQQQRNQQQPQYVYTTSYQDPRTQEHPGVPHVIRGRVITSGSDKMGEFDKIIAESIRQFLIQSQQQQQQQQQQQYQGSAPWSPTSSDPSKSHNVEISELHIPCGGQDQMHQQQQHPSFRNDAQTGNDPSDDRNIFKKYKFKFDSIGNFSRSNSRDDGLVGDSEPGTGNISRNAPIAIFRFHDFDDMVARMNQLRQAQPDGASVDMKQQDGVRGFRGQAPNGGNTYSVTAQPIYPNQMAQGYQYNQAGGQQLRSRGQGPKDARSLSREILRHKIEVFNCNANGLIMSLEQDSDTFHGFIRVQMNLIRPVQMEVAAQPATLFDVIKPEPSAPAAPTPETPSTPQDDSQTTTFYLPKDSSKVIHINSDTTTKEVIRQLLGKFKIKDNPLKFALYHKCGEEENSSSMRRLNEEELPLPMCLGWTDEGADGLTRNKFILQENDTGEILWDAFSLPELENFLMILNKEEEEYLREMKSTYRLLKIQLQKRFKELKRDRIQQENNNEDTNIQNEKL